MTGSFSKLITIINLSSELQGRRPLAFISPRDVRRGYVPFLPPKFSSNSISRGDLYRPRGSLQPPLYRFSDRLSKVLFSLRGSGLRFWVASYGNWGRATTPGRLDFSLVSESCFCSKEPCQHDYTFLVWTLGYPGKFLLPHLAALNTWGCFL